MHPKYAPLSREQVADSVRGRAACRPPLAMHKWPGEGLREYHGDALEEVFQRYPDDVVWGDIRQPGAWEAPEGMPENYRWAFKDKPSESARVGRDSGASVISDWSELDDFLEGLPEPTDPAVFEPVRRAVERADGRYVIARAWNYFYERLWMLRGMQNVLMDFHLHGEELQRLCDGLLEFALQLVEGAARAGADAFSSSNDLGHQNGLMMGPGPFREFLKPRLAKLAEAAHERGMEFWLHSCGDLTDALEDMVDIGVDCLHPLQYGAMDWTESARRIRGRMTAWAGADVQHVMPEGNPEDVRRHVRHMVDTFYVPGRGRLVVAAGNGIIAPTTLENIDAFLDESYRYGLQVST